MGDVMQNVNAIVDIDTEPTVEEFLAIFGDVKCFRTFNDKDRDENGKNFTGSFAAQEKKLRRHNSSGRGVYFIPNPGGHKDRDIKSIVAVFLDLDGSPLEPVLDACQDSGITPHAVVESSPGRYHVYFLVSNIPAVKEDFRKIQQALAKRFSGDTTICNPSRVMRLPGFYHHKKDEPFLSHVLELNPDAPRYTKEEIIDGFQLVLQSEKRFKPLILAPIGSNGEVKRNCRLTSYCGSLEAKNYGYDEILNRAMSENARFSDPVSTTEVTKVVNSIWNYRQDRINLLGQLVDQLNQADIAERIAMIQDDTAKNLLRLCEATDAVAWNAIENLFTGKKKFLKAAVKPGSVPRLAEPTGNMMLDSIPGLELGPPPGLAAFPTPFGYSFIQTEKGVSIIRTTEDDKREEVASTPVFITKSLDRIDGEGMLEVSWVKKGSWKSIISSRNNFLSATRILDLAQYFFPVSSYNAKQLVRYLHDCESTFDSVIPSQRISSQMGWHDDAFILGSECISPASEPIVFQSHDVGEQALVRGIGQQGSFDVWCEAVRKISHLPVPMLAIYASLAAPLLKILDVPGFGIDFAGRTSTGKTTCCRLGASVWGQPDEGHGSSVTHTWDSTQVGVERLCAVMCDLPVILDDTKRAKADKIGDIVYGIISGQGRGRGSKKGLQVTQSWRVTFLSSGEAPIIAYTNDAGVRSRILTIRPLPFEDCYKQDEVANLNQVIKANHGHLGRRWIEYLQSIKDEWSTFKEILSDLVCTEFKPRTNVESRLAEKAALLRLVELLLMKGFGLDWEFNNPAHKLWKNIRTEAAETDIHIRAAWTLYDWAVSHQTQFVGQHKSEKSKNDDGPPIEPAGGWAGRWDSTEREADHSDEREDAWEHIDFKRDTIIKVCRLAGFDDGAVLDGLKASGMAEDTRTRILGKAVQVFRIKREDLMPNYGK